MKKAGHHHRATAPPMGRGQVPEGKKKKKKGNKINGEIL